MIEYIGGIESVVNVVFQHADVYFVVFDESLQIFEFCDVAIVTSCDVVVEEVQVMLVEYRAGFHIFFE